MTRGIFPLRAVILLLILMPMIFFVGCGDRSNYRITETGPGSSISSPDVVPPEPDLKNTETPRDSGGVVPLPVDTPKTGNFTPQELEEIRRDGYLSYFYRRKYSPEEIQVAWKSVNTLFHDYSPADKQLALRSVLAYHWLVYRTTSHHYLPANLAVTRKYEHLIEKFASKHDIPVPMLKGVITWENSGGEGKISWAACAGVGQMSMGAMKEAHQYYKERVAALRKTAEAYEDNAAVFNLPILKTVALAYRNEADYWDIEKRHKQIAREKGIADERLIPECNIEDAAVYLKILYEDFNRRVDLAIPSYHSGSLNSNDILRDYLNRHHGTALGQNARQQDISRAVAGNNLRFINIWKDARSRDMLNGLRTVFGHPTTPENKHLSLGDESDLYTWKIAGAYGALIAPEKTVRKLVNKYRGEWDIIECRGLKTYTSSEQIRADIKSGWLVPLPKVYEDKGISGYKNAGKEYYRTRASLNYYVLPETAGMLLEIADKYRKRTGNPHLKVPLRAALDSRMLEIYPPGKIPEQYLTHLQGVSLDIDLANAPHSGILSGIINEMYLHDRIYRTRSGGANRITVNPRYGKVFFRSWKLEVRG